MEDNEQRRGEACKGKYRYVIAILACFGLGIIYGLKVNLHVAIVAMVNNTALAKMEGGNHTEPHTVGGDGPFAWKKSIQGLLLSAYFWGYIVAQLPGGRISEMVSAKWVMFFAVVLNIVCTFLTPAISQLHFGGLLVLRILQGIGGGVTFPSTHVMLANWAPPNERSVLSSIAYAGTALGTVFFMYITGVISGHLGWEYVFYIEGAISCIWLFFWAVFCYDSPGTARFVSDKERQFIADALHTDAHAGKHSVPAVPWKNVFTSLPFWSILILHTCSNFGWYLVLIELPIYFKSILHVDIKEDAFLTALPYLCMWIFSMILSKVLGTLLSKNKIDTTMARKIASGFAIIPAGIIFIVLAHMGDQRSLGIGLMTLAITCIGGMYSGFLSNHIDIAPNYAGTLMALTNTIATIPGVLVPILVGLLTEADSTITSWIIIFWTTVAIYAFGITFYLIFASGKEQPWNALPNEPGESQPLKATKP